MQYILSFQLIKAFITSLFSVPFAQFLISYVKSDTYQIQFTDIKLPDITTLSNIQLTYPK